MTMVSILSPLSQLEWQETIDLLQRLIQAHPVYASEGLKIAQEHLLQYMQHHHWDQAILDTFNDHEINDLEGYVDVASFGSIYSQYSTVPKCNVIGVVDSKRAGPTLILNGHVDVDLVSEPHAWSLPNGWSSGKIEGDRLYGRGATDMLSGLVAMITAANHFHYADLDWCGKIIVTAVTDEEIGGNGTLRSLHWLQKKNWLNESTECLIAEPSNENICISSLGFMHLKATFNRQPVHMGVAKKENSSLWDACQFIQDLDQMVKHAAKRVESSIDESKCITNIGIIQGGQDAAIPIPSTQSEATIFYPESLTAMQLETALRNEIRKKFPLALIEIGAFGFPGADYSHSLLFKSLIKEHPSKRSLFPSPCDARLYKIFNIPTVIYGPGFLEEAHSINESISLSELKNYIHVLIKGIKNYLTA
jgi:acetylornithine deacetylase